MCESKFTTVELPFGIFYERTSFWLNDFYYNSSDKSMKFNLTLSQLQDSDPNKPRKKTNFELSFSIVRTFSMLQYDDFQMKYTSHSQSNFDYLKIEDKNKYKLWVYDEHSNYLKQEDKKENLYLLWTYDECFEIYAKDYTFSA